MITKSRIRRNRAPVRLRHATEERAVSITFVLAHFEDGECYDRQSSGFSICTCEQRQYHLKCQAALSELLIDALERVLTAPDGPKYYFCVESGTSNTSEYYFLSQFLTLLRPG